MSANIKFEFEAELRNDVGRGASRRLRRLDKVPAVVYGAGEKPTLLLLDHNKVSNALSHEAFYAHILTLKVGKKSEKVILKAMQRHPAKSRIEHIDFMRVRADQKLTMNVPLHFIGEEDAPGLKEGAVFAHLISDVEVTCLPADLPEYIEVDVAQMGLNDVLHLSHLKLPKGVELVALMHGSQEGRDATVVTLQVPRVIEEEVTAAPAEGEEAAAEGEVPASEQKAVSEEPKE